MEATGVKKALVVGAGVMGHSIAQVLATAGIQTNLVDVNQDVLDHARKLIGFNLETLAEYGRVKKGDIPQIIGRIAFGVDLRGACKGVDFVIEAVAESIDIKQKVFAELEANTPPGTILASNTSALDVFNVLKFTDPSRILITHWFAPPHIIPLVEVVPGPATKPECMKLAVSLMERAGKRPVVMRQFVQSFIVNRVQNYIGLAVLEMLSNGWATPEEIDRAIKTSLAIRIPVVGVVQSYDFTGLDLVSAVIKNSGLNYPIIDNLVKEGRLGAKTGAGFYEYQGRTEEEILRKRDTLYLRMYDFLEGLNGFKAV
jgi:3-hydroxybutyryl-CoA dehydrogenase